MAQDTSSFLALPLELRLNIYEHLVPSYPYMQPRNDYIGLLYACRQIQNEFEPELLKQIEVFYSKLRYKSLADDLGWMEFTIPQTMKGTQNIVLGRPQCRTAFQDMRLLNFLQKLHIDCLTFKVYPQEEPVLALAPPASQSKTKDLSQHTIKEFRSFAALMTFFDSRQIWVKKWVFDWTDCPVRDDLGRLKFVDAYFNKSAPPHKLFEYCEIESDEQNHAIRAILWRKRPKP